MKNGEKLRMMVCFSCILQSRDVKREVFRSVVKGILPQLRKKDGVG